MMKRGRRVSCIAGVAAAVLLSGIGAMWLLRWGDATRSPSLPRHLGAPGLFTFDGQRSPLGAASVAFSGQHSLTDGDEPDQYTVTVAGARSDTYRSLSVDSIAGFSAILSPDGRRLAVANGIVDLTTGALTRLPHANGDDRYPEAWSPDGRYLATVEYAYAGAVIPKVARATFSVTDTATGHATVFDDLPDPAAFDGWIAAFAPNDDIAYQVGTSIRIAGPTGAQLHTLTVPAGTRVAGKGAWTTGGDGLTVVSESACRCGRRWDARWTLSTITIATGDRTGASYPVDGVVAVRMLGWAGGRPVVQTFEPGRDGLDSASDRIVDFRPQDPASDYGDDYDYLYEVENLDEVYGSRVLLLTGDGAPRTLLSGGDQAESVDVADSLIPGLANTGGVTRNGYPPILTGTHLLEAGVVALLALLVAWIVAVIKRAVRRRRANTGHEAMRWATAARL